MCRFLRGVALCLLLTVPLALLSRTLAYGEEGSLSGSPPEGDCATCHGDIYAVWQSSAHGLADQDKVFAEAWKSKGGPKECLACHTTGYDPATGTWAADGVACQACHGPALKLHPTEPMPVERSADFCGDCHTETFFEWRVSQHGVADVGCINCHDPHATTLKAGDASGLCANCHGSRAASFAHSKHHEQGLTCADCHLSPLKGVPSEGQGKRDHTFSVNLDTCTGCHGYQLHSSTGGEVNLPTPMPVDAMASSEGAQVSLKPASVSPMIFAALSGLIGMATGMILAPWLERWYRRIRSEDG